MAYYFSDASPGKINIVWKKGGPIDKYDEREWRYDMCGTVMNFPEHGNRDSEYGWEIDHIEPVALGGGDELTNLQPLNWQNNVKKGDQYPWNCE